MLKKTLLSILLATSTIATAQINLDLNATLTHQEAQHQLTGNVVVDENVTSSVVFNGLESLVIAINAQNNDNNVTIQAQFFQKTDAEELEAATEVFTVEVPLNEAASITVNDVENDGSFVLVITPSLVE